MPIHVKHVHSSLPYQQVTYQKYGRHGMNRLVGMGLYDAGLPTVPYFTVQYRILTPVPSVPYGTENVPFLRNFVI